MLEDGRKDDLKAIEDDLYMWKKTYEMKTKVDYQTKSIDYLEPFIVDMQYYFYIHCFIAIHCSTLSCVDIVQ